MKMRKREAHLREKEAKRERKPKKSCLSFRNIFARSEQNIVEANGLWFTPALHLLIGMQNSAAQPSLFTFSQLTPLWLATWEEKKRKFSCSTTSKSPKDHSIRSLKSEMQQRETKFEPIALKLKWCQLLCFIFEQRRSTAALGSKKKQVERRQEWVSSFNWMAGRVRSWSSKVPSCFLSCLLDLDLLPARVSRPLLKVCCPFSVAAFSASVSRFLLLSRSVAAVSELLLHFNDPQENVQLSIARSLHDIGSKQTEIVLSSAVEFITKRAAQVSACVACSLTLDLFPRLHVCHQIDVLHRVLILKMLKDVLDDFSENVTSTLARQVAHFAASEIVFSKVLLACFSWSFCSVFPFCFLDPPLARLSSLSSWVFSCCLCLLALHPNSSLFFLDSSSLSCLFPISPSFVALPSLHLCLLVFVLSRSLILIGREQLLVSLLFYVSVSLILCWKNYCLCSNLVSFLPTSLSRLSRTVQQRMVGLLAMQTRFRVILIRHVHHLILFCILCRWLLIQLLLSLFNYVMCWVVLFLCWEALNQSRWSGHLHAVSNASNLPVCAYCCCVLDWFVPCCVPWSVLFPSSLMALISFACRASSAFPLLLFTFLLLFLLLASCSLSVGSLQRSSSSFLGRCKCGTKTANSSRYVSEWIQVCCGSYIHHVVPTSSRS